MHKIKKRLDIIPNGRYISDMNKERKISLIKEITVLFAEKGYESLGVSLIAEKCGISKPTLYYYFESKENLLISIVEYYGSILRKELHFELAEDGEDIVTLVDRFLKFTYNNPEYFRLYLSLIFTPHKNRAYQIIKTEAETIQQIVETILCKYKRTSTNIPLLAVSLIGQMNSFATIILNGYLPYSNDLAKQVVKLFTYGADNYE